MLDEPTDTDLDRKIAAGGSFLGIYHAGTFTLFLHEKFSEEEVERVRDLLAKKLASTTPPGKESPP